MTVGQSARRRLRGVLKGALQRLQATAGYSRVMRALPLRVELAHASERDLRLLRLLRVQPSLPQRASGHIVARVCGLPLGYIYAGTDPPHETPYEGVWLCRLRVSPLVRRLGIAEALVQRGALDARREGFGEVFSLVFRDNLASQRLCVKLGFEHVALPRREGDPEVSKPWEVWRLGLP
jgi:RimJ/RimL family protein N-acetyltransferase